MKIQIESRLIPGTILPREAMGGVSGIEFLNKVFFISDGIMLSQIKDIAGIDGTTLQNWTKRGWVDTPKAKKYTKDQLALILIINMMRDCIRLDHIAFIVSFINGRVYDRSDNIVRESTLYDYVCRVLDRLDASGDMYANGHDLRECVSEVTSDYEEAIRGSASRLRRAIEVIVTAYGAAMIKKKADGMIDSIMKI